MADDSTLLRGFESPRSTPKNLGGLWRLGGSNLQKRRSGGHGHVYGDLTQPFPTESGQ